jgi:hypothetical protein
MLPKYDLIENKNSFHSDHWCVKILDGEYVGLVYQYDIVRIHEDKEGDGAELKFNTVTIENPNKISFTDENDKGILGAVLVDIIKTQMEQMRDENGTLDIKEPTT